MRAACLDLLSSAVAVRTDRFGLHTSKEAVDCLYHTSATLALAAGLVGSTILRTCAMTVFALDIFLDLDMFLNTVGNVLKVDFHPHADIRSSRMRSFVVEARKASASAKEGIEDVERIETSSAKSTCLRAIETKLVVVLSPLWVAQHLVCLSNFLEHFLGSLVSWILVRMILYCQFAISFLNFVVSGVFAHAQYLIIILFFHFHTF